MTITSNTIARDTIRDPTAWLQCVIVISATLSILLINNLWSVLLNRPLPHFESPLHPFAQLYASVNSSLNAVILFEDISPPKLGQLIASLGVTRTPTLRSSIPHGGNRWKLHKDTRG